MWGEGGFGWSRAVIVSLLCEFARLEAAYDMHFCRTMRGVRVVGRDIDFVPLGAVLLVLDALVIWILLWLGLGWSGNGMLSNMNVIILRAWMFC